MKESAQYLTYTSNPNQSADLGIKAIPATITNDATTLKMTFAEVCDAMQGNICFIRAMQAEGILLDLVVFVTYETFTVYTQSGLELVADSADGYPTNEQGD